MFVEVSRYGMNLTVYAQANLTLAAVLDTSPTHSHIHEFT